MELLVIKKELRGPVNEKTTCSICVCRYLVNPDQTLQIHYVTAQDAGKYTCTAANDVGVVTASAQLLVEGKMMSEDAGIPKDFLLLHFLLKNIIILFIPPTHKYKP